MKTDEKTDRGKSNTLTHALQAASCSELILVILSRSRDSRYSGDNYDRVDHGDTRCDTRRTHDDGNG